ncbi:MAG: alpha-N-arabinofuranosidase [Alphaproteobacteria bacterium]|nr:alpha-N-arabinofuranosidase [Alphaproteobacteria bacterium]
MRPAISGILLALGLSCAAAQAQDAIAIKVDTSQPGATIDRHIFGQFAEQLGTQIYNGIWVGRDSKIPNVRGIRKDVVAALRELHVPDVRWPGGCYADQYHWRDGVGKTRTTRVNTSWGDVLDSNAFGTGEYFDFLHQIGSQAYISVNLGSGTVQEAADWLEYMTADQPTTLAKERAANGHPAPYKVAYLGLGNESWDCGGLMTPTEYTARMRRFARFVNDFDPAQKMQKIAVGPGTPDTDWTDAVMSTWKKRHGWSFDLDGMSLHSYTVAGGWPPHMPSMDFGEQDYASVLQETLKMNGLIDKQSAVMDQYDPEKKIALVVDEWGAWLAPTPGSNPHFLQQQNSQRDAILAALNLNIFARHADRVRMANIAQMVNVLQAMLMTDGPKMIRTPTYYVFKMYVPFQDATFLPVTYDAGSYTYKDITLPRVDAIAAKAKDGKIVVSLTNLDPNRPADFAVTVPGAAATVANGQVLAAPAVDAVNTFAAPYTVSPKPVSAQVSDGKLSITLPPASVTVLTLDR